MPRGNCRPYGRSGLRNIGGISARPRCTMTSPQRTAYRDPNSPSCRVFADNHLSQAPQRHVPSPTSPTGRHSWSRGCARCCVEARPSSGSKRASRSSAHFPMGMSTRCSARYGRSVWRGSSPPSAPQSGIGWWPWSSRVCSTRVPSSPRHEALEKGALQRAWGRCSISTIVCRHGLVASPLG